MSEKIKLIEKILKTSGADGYEITETKETGWEFYFIRHKLDQNRTKELTEYKVKVFKVIPGENADADTSDMNEKKFLGNAVGNIPPTASEEEIKKMIDDLVYQAGLVKNPYYELNKPDDSGSTDEKPDHAIDVAQISKDFIEAFDAVSETETEDINSYEIFVSKKDRHFVNSNGINLSFSYPDSMLEVVTNARNYPKASAEAAAMNKADAADNDCRDDSDRKCEDEYKEIELYRLYKRGTCDRDALIYDVEELLKMGKDRLIAIDTPAIKTAPLIMSTIDSRSIYYYFLYRVGAANKYMGISSCELGVPIASDIKGDKLTLKVLPELANSSMNFLYDSEGAPIRERYLIKDGIPENFWGSRQFSEYLGLSGSSDVYNFSVSGGTKTAAELRTGPYLEVVEFSGFDCDTTTGDIAGEIRLGYWHDGEKVTPVTGGSVSGNMSDFVKEMYRNKDSTTMF